MRTRLTIFACALLISMAVLRVPASSFQAAAPRSASPSLDESFQKNVRPFLQTYCFACHSGKEPAAGLDLTSESDLDAVTKDQRRWSLVLARLKAGEMPPSQARQHPTAMQVQPVIDWIQSMAAQEARRHPDDPGIVLARRLSNAEYDYTVRDLTGADIRPTKEFPVDPANQAGFDNSGESLAMSPELVKKYLDAARLVADHIVFLPKGFSFAPYPVVTDEDRDKYGVNRVVDFYKRQPLDYADYFRAAWRYRYRAALQRSSATLTDFARDAKVSPTYLKRLWTMLTSPGEDAGPIAALQARWKNLPPPAGNEEPDSLRPAVGSLADFITNLRPRVAMSFDNLPARGIAAGSQSLVLWKDRQFATHRTSCAASLAEVDLSDYAQSDPRLVLPESDAARARYDDSFARFCALFPDRFYVSERGRMFMTNPRDIASDAQGHRLLSAGFHSQMGYFRDDAPLSRAGAGRRTAASAGWRVEGARLRHARARAPVQAVHLVRARRAAEFHGQPAVQRVSLGRRRCHLRGEDRADGRRVPGKGARGDQRRRARRGARLLRAHECERSRAGTGEGCCGAEPPRCAPDIRRARLSPAADDAEKNDLLAFYRSLRKQDELGHEEALRDTLASVLMSPPSATA